MANGGESDLRNFGRRFCKDWLRILKGRPGWWRDVLDCKFEDVSGAQQPLFLAVRDGYLNAYVDGQSILRIEFRGSELIAEIHHKYIVDGAKDQKYKVFNGKTVDGQDYYGKSTLSKWIERARGYSSQEKQGVAVMLDRNPHIIDVEMALPGVVADRIDIVALERAGAAINIVFYEVKRFNNRTLRADKLSPKVLEQLGRYENWLTQEGREEQVTRAYREACRLLIEFRTMQGTSPVHHLIEKASQFGSKLKVDPKVRLIIFGYGENRLNKFWNRHEKALRDAGVDGRRLIMQARAEDITLPDISRQDKLSALARFSPIFSDADFRFATWHQSILDTPDVIELPYCTLSDDAAAFVEAAYAAGWVIPLDWSAWMGTEEAKELVTSSARISTASEEQIAKLLTAHIRGDKFTDGVLLRAFESGLLGAVVRRAETLLLK